MRNRLTPLFALVLTVGMLLTSAESGATASSGVEATRGGDGSGPVSGYEVSDIHYSLAPADPSTIDRVEFALDAPATKVKVELAGGWYDCSSVGTQIRCDLQPGVPVVAIDSLRVVATD